MFKISDNTVRRYDKIVLQTDTPPPMLDGYRGREKLADLLKANESLSKAYLLKEQFRGLFNDRYQGWAQRALSNWCEMAQESGLAPFQRLARDFTKQSRRVCGFVKHGLTSGLIEGFNNLISRIIHKACGIRDLDYLELKLRYHSATRS